MARLPADVHRSRWLAVLVVAGVYLVGSLLPLPRAGRPVPRPLGIAGADAWLHAVGAAALAVTIARALADGERSSTGVVGLVVVLVLAYTTATELLQLRVPTRWFQSTDLLANAVGVAAAVLILWTAARLGRGPLSSTAPDARDGAP